MKIAAAGRRRVVSNKLKHGDVGEETVEVLVLINDATSQIELQEGRNLILALDKK